jgi:hypothetical protein
LVAHFAAVWRNFRPLSTLLGVFGIFATFVGYFAGDSTFWDFVGFFGPDQGRWVENLVNAVNVW